jgi:hypothetical protein
VNTIIEKIEEIKNNEETSYVIKAILGFCDYIAEGEYLCIIKKYATPPIIPI